MWHLAKSVWGATETTDVASQQESTTLSSIWNGVRNMFTEEEVAVEMQEMNVPMLEAPPVGDAPRLLSAEGIDEPAFDLGLDEWDELPNLQDAPEFMSLEYVEDLEVRELAIDSEFAPTQQLELMNMELPELVSHAYEDSMLAADVAG